MIDGWKNDRQIDDEVGATGWLMINDRWKTDGWMEGGWQEKVNERIIDSNGGWMDDDG